MSESRKTAKKRATRRASTPEARENQLISMAFDAAEQQLRDGTASSQIITQLLKRGSARERLEMDRLREENAMLKAKTELLESQKNVGEEYTKALEAFRSYSGSGVMYED